MAENLLRDILNREIDTEKLCKWLSEQNHQFNQNVEFSQFTCTTEEFISYFLNYIHEDVPSFDIENTNKITFTPKSIRNTDDKTRSEHKVIKRRSALFPDLKNEVRVAHSHNFPVIPTKCSYDVNKENTGGDTKNNETSTPKLFKIQSDSTLDNTYNSPVSPLYSRSSLTTPKGRNSLGKSGEKSLCLGDFIVHRKSSSKKKVQRNLCDVSDMQNGDTFSNKKCRRINPTNLSEKKFNTGFKESENSFNFKNNFIELSVDNLNEQRNLLVEERLKIKNNIDDLIKTPNVVKLQTLNNKTEIIALPEKVTFTNQLDILIIIYEYFLNNNYNLNLASEVHFLISLLLTKQYINSDSKLNDSDSDIQELDHTLNQKNIFKTVHNCVYFAVKVLKTQVEILKCLDRITLKLLFENERIKLFSPDFCSTLISIYSNKLEQLKEVTVAGQRNVCFMSDTDNRDNFATDASFHAFRKQRDLFYEILRIWEQNHFLPEWNFSIALGGKIRGLLNLHNDPVNYRHFARLFKMQLLTVCRQTNNDEAIFEQQASILASLPNVDADKLHRLKNRLVTKGDSSDLSSTPTFTGVQEFYKDFLLACGSHIFYQHLKNSLVLEMTYLTNNSTFNGFFENDQNDCVDATTRNHYFTSLKCLRVLAKFLGFLESLPYKTEPKVISEKVSKAEIETRQWHQPIFDLEAIILKSLRDKTLILIIPWICKYLSMLDYITLRLPYFTKILEILFYIQRGFHIQREDESCPTPFYNRTLIRISLGWLFELPHFPSDLYFKSLSKLSNGDSTDLLSNLNHLSIDRTGAFKTIAGTGQMKTGRSLDELDFVDQRILYACCPYLEGFRKLLANNSSNAGHFVKHITPLSAVESSVDISEKKIRSQLEEAFFNGQPISVRKTVEFVSERVASSCVKHICNIVVPDFKRNSLAKAKIILQELVNSSDVDPKLLESILKMKNNELGAEYLKELQTVCADETERLTNQRIPASIDALLAVDELEQTKDTCSAITKRLCIDRVQQWINSHVNIALFNKTLNIEAQKMLVSSDREPRDKPVFLLPPGGRNVNHNDDTKSIVKALEIIRNISIDLLESKPITSAYIQDWFRTTEKTILERCDVNDQILSMMNRILVDVLLLLLTHKIDIIEENLPFFLNHWKIFVRTGQDLFKSLICSRNVMLIAQSKNVARSWSYLAKSIVRLLEMELLSCESFEAQCIAIYQKEWDKDTLKLLSTCFQDVIDGVKDKEPTFNQFSCLLEFMSSFCSDMDF